MRFIDLVGVVGGLFFFSAIIFGIYSMITIAIEDASLMEDREQICDDLSFNDFKYYEGQDAYYCIRTMNGVVVERGVELR